MTYTTRCPACGTTFRVVPDQLKISDGWVRCGHCSDVFDATLNLQPWHGDPSDASGGSPPDAASAPTSSPAASEAQVAGPEPGPEPGLDSPTEDEPMASGWEDSDFMAELQRYASQARTGVAAEPVESGTLIASDLQTDSRAPASGAPSPVPSPQVVVPAPMPEAEPAVQIGMEPGFVVQARRRAFWSSTGVRAVMLVLVLVLGAVLVGQWALHERDAVAARWPGARPALERACEHLGCKVAALKRIDDVVIDSSTLQRRLGNFYAFELVLKNRADVPLAAPALELSLTDLRDQVITRRVFLPQEMPGMPAELPARGTVSTSLRLSIALGNDVSMSGFRALVFYP